MLWFAGQNAFLFAIFTVIVSECQSKKNHNEEIHGLYKDVMTKQGIVRGRKAEDGDYFAFLGIRYAAAPKGENRFKDPMPPPLWDRVLEANYTIKCPQKGIGDEDCLIVNVFTPLKTAFKHPLPVLVYIHGGSFLIGHGHTNGVYPLIKQNIIVVTLNYRLGVLGFLCLGIEDVPGNAGLKDQVAALKWVKENIRNFGGDPNLVTIYGMSAGGASVELHVLSKMSKGLFQRAIIESGSALNVWVTDANPINTALDFAKSLGFSSKEPTVYELANFYQNMNAQKLSNMAMQLYNNLTDGTAGFSPCVERTMKGKETFMTETPYKIHNKVNFDNVPIMFFFSTLEGLFLRSEEYYKLRYKERMESNFLQFLPGDLSFDTDEIRHDIGEIIKQYYFPDGTLEGDVIKYLNYFGDSQILHGFLNSVKVHAEGKYPVYLMEFSYRGNMGSYEQFYDNINLAGHGDVMKHAILTRPVQNKDDKQMVEKVSKIIGYYVTHGNPSPSRSKLIPTLWSPVQPNKMVYMHLDKDIRILEEPYRERKSFWDKIYRKYRREINAVDPSVFN